jgi:uncharacterized membrane protein YgcG
LIQQALAEEHIKRLDVTITVREQGELFVEELFEVWSEATLIRHGIYRDFPTDYTDKSGRPIRVDFAVQSLTRDGRSEPYHTERVQNGIRTYFGSKDTLLTHGTHRYRFAYITTRQIGFFEDHDELYFNAIGTGWQFPIHHSSVRVILPQPSKHLVFDSYSGYQGESFHRSYDIQESNQFIRFDLAAPLEPQQGFTIFVEWEKGIVKPPTQLMRWRYALSDYSSVLLSLIVLIGGIWFYIDRWQRLGKDNLSETIIPQFQPPTDLSPAAAQYILNMGANKKLASTVFVSLAAKGLLQINKTDGFFRSSYALKKQDDKHELPLSAEEQKAYDLLPDEIEIKQAHYRIFQAVKSAIDTSLASQFSGKYFRPHTGYIAFGIIFPIVAGLLFFISQSGVLGVVSLLTTSICIASALLLFLGWVLFARAMPAPTKKGKPVMDHLAGFKQYLNIADRERLNLLNAPGDSLELFEAYLPFAIALGVANNWTTRFSSLLNQLSEEQLRSHAWYHAIGTTGDGIADFSSSLSSQITSASTAPGSSSGSGGSSGGGGGGGGGGGW